MLRKWPRNAGKDARTGEKEATAVTEENAENAETVIEAIEPTKAIERGRKTEMIEKIE